MPTCKVLMPTVRFRCFYSWHRTSTSIPPLPRLAEAHKVGTRGERDAARRRASACRWLHSVTHSLTPAPPGGGRCLPRRDVLMKWVCLFTLVRGQSPSVCGHLPVPCTPLIKHNRLLASSECSCLASGAKTAAPSVGPTADVGINILCY